MNYDYSKNTLKNTVLASKPSRGIYLFLMVLIIYITPLASFGQTPTISSFTPTNACLGASIIITGNNFTGATSVQFNGVTAVYIINSSTQITTQLPVGATSGSIKVTNSSGTGTSATSFNDQTSYGSNTWIGYVYASTNGGNPPTNAFTTNYVGYITQPEIFDYDLGGGSISGPNLCNTYADNFAVRYKMNKNMPAGNYTFNVGGDDGYRLSVDGGMSYVINDKWGNHAYQNSTQTVYLNGNTNFVLEYFETTGQSRVQFSYTFPPTAIAGLSSLCAGAGGTTLTATGGNLAIGSFYQWGTGSSVGNNIIAGQTGASLIINPSSTTVYWVRILDSNNTTTVGITKTITVNPLPSTPGNAAAYSPTCTGFTSQWAYSNNATKYFLDVSTNNAFSSFVSGYNNLDVGNNLFQVLTGLNPGTTYYYRVRAYNGCGTSNSSSTMIYATADVPTTPPIANAASNIVCNAATLNWGSVANANGYYIDIATDSGFFNFVAGFNNFYVGYVNYYASGLPSGILYYRIRATNSCGITTLSSNTVSFSTPAPLGGSVSPAQTVCRGNAPTVNLTLSGHSTTNVNIIRWEKATDLAFTTNLASISETTNVLPIAKIGALTVSTYFRAVLQNQFGSWCTSYSIPVLIMATTPTTIALNKTDKTCSINNDGTISPVLSGGLSNIRYIKLTQKYSDWQQVQEIQAFEVFTNTNVALASNGTTANSSSNYSDDATTYGPQKAIDGDAIGYSFWHGNSTNINEWIKVDLTSGKNIDYLRIYNRSSCCQSRGQNMLLELFDTSDNVVYSKTVDLYGGVNGAHYIEVNVLDLSWSDGSTTLNRTGLNSGTYTLNFNEANGCSNSKTAIIGATNISPSTPTVGTTTQPTCVTPTGSVVLSGLSSGTLYQKQGSVVTSSVITGTTMTISGLAAGTYTFTVSNGTCTSIASTPVIINTLSIPTNTYSGTTWSAGTPPTTNGTHKLVFNSAFLSSADLSGCSCQANADVTIKTGHTLTLTNELTVATGKNMAFQDGASLVQQNNVANTGEINYNRTTYARKTDYTYWSTPVNSPSQTLGALVAPDGTFYSYETNASSEGWVKASAGTVMIPGKGYIGSRGLEVPTGTPPSLTLNVTFQGNPNNGPYSMSVFNGKSCLLGNPYPSAISAYAFLLANNGVLDGTLYFWTHNTAIQDKNNIPGNNPDGTPKAGSGAYTFTSDDYATYNGTGGAAVSLGAVPNAYIAAGQGFFSTATATSSVNYYNSMRVSGTTNIAQTGINQQFFKTRKDKTDKDIEKNRIWLNLMNTKGAFKQALVGYITGATNDYESRFDGESYDGNEFVDFYSVNQDKNLTIQGRALPFNENDEVPLGYRSAIDGDFTISIDQVDGALTSQNVYIEDKSTNTTFDLKSGNYNFTTTAGTFNDRFVLRYTDKTLGTNNFNSLDNKVLVSFKNKQIKVNSYSETIAKVTIYDFLGRQVYQKDKINSTEFSASNLNLSHQVVVVKTTLQNGSTHTDKVIF